MSTIINIEATEFGRPALWEERTEQRDGTKKTTVITKPDGSKPRAAFISEVCECANERHALIPIDKNFFIIRVEARNSRLRNAKVLRVIDVLVNDLTDRYEAIAEVAVVNQLANYGDWDDELPAKLHPAINAAIRKALMEGDAVPGAIYIDRTPRPETSQQRLEREIEEAWRDRRLEKARQKVELNKAVRQEIAEERARYRETIIAAFKQHLEDSVAYGVELEFGETMVICHNISSDSRYYGYNQFGLTAFRIDLKDYLVGLQFKAKSIKAMAEAEENGLSGVTCVERKDEDGTFHTKMWVITPIGATRSHDRSTSLGQIEKTQETRIYWNVFSSDELILWWNKPSVVASHEFLVINKPKNLTDAQIQCVSDIEQMLEDVWIKKFDLALDEYSPSVGVGWGLSDGEVSPPLQEVQIERPDEIDYLDY